MLRFDRQVLGVVKTHPMKVVPKVGSYGDIDVKTNRDTVDD